METIILFFEDIDWRLLTALVLEAAVFFVLVTHGWGPIKR